MLWYSLGVCQCEKLVGYGCRADFVAQAHELTEVMKSQSEIVKSYPNALQHLWLLLLPAPFSPSSSSSSRFCLLSSFDDGGPWSCYHPLASASLTDHQVSPE